MCILVWGDFFYRFPLSCLALFMFYVIVVTFEFNLFTLPFSVLNLLRMQKLVYQICQLLLCFALLRCLWLSSFSNFPFICPLKYL